MATDEENFTRLAELEELDALRTRQAVHEEEQEIAGILAEEGGAWEQGGRGILQGLKGTGRSAANLLLPESLEPEWATKEAVRRQGRIDEGSLHGWGTAGKFAGEMLATAPLGAVGMGARALRGGQLAAKYLPKAAAALKEGGRVSQAAGRGLPKAAEAIGRNRIARTAVHPATAAAAEGAGVGALFADPDKRAQGALMGAGAGGLLGAGAAAAGRLPFAGKLGGRGTVPISETAEAVEKSIGKKLPLAMASAGEEGMAAGLAGATYRQALPMFPLARQTLAKGTGQAVVDMNEAMIRKAYGHGGKQVDEIVEEMIKISGKPDRGFREAIQYGDDAIRSLKGKAKLPYAAYTKMRQAMTDVSSKAGKEGFSPADVAKQLRKLAPESTPQGLRELQNMEQLLAQGGLESTAFGRRAFYSAGNEADSLFSKLLGATEVVGGGVFTKSIASKWFQNALRQDPVLKKKVAKYLGEPTLKGLEELVRSARRVQSGKAAPLPEETQNAP